MTDVVDLGLAGRVLESTFIEYTAQLVFAEDCGVTLDSPFTMTTDEGEFCLDPNQYLEQDDDFDRVRQLVGVTVTAAVYDESGHLEIRFAGDTVIRSGPDGGYEAWNYAGPNGVKIICLPSGGLMTFSAIPDTAEEDRAAIDADGAPRASRASWPRALFAEGAKYRRRNAP